MRFNKLTVLLLLTIGIFVGAVGIQAQGPIVPRECERCPRPPRPVTLPRSLPIKSIKIDTKIVGQVATTHLEQIFRNDTAAVLEGIYFFPIPEQASIVEFAIWDGNNRLVGEVRGREEARRIYDEIVRRQRDPGLLEYAGKDLFQASIFPIPANSDKKLELTYTQVLHAEGGTVSYKYPLGTSQQQTAIQSVSGRVEIESQQPVRNIYSPSHSIDVNRSNDRKTRITFESGRAEELTDFQLFYALSKDDFGLSVFTHREPGKDGYFLLMLSPKETISEQELAAKDIVFVIDTSGSMADAGKMDKARAALLFGIRSLRNGDRFNVISFAGEEHLMENGLLNADERGKARGEEFVKGLRPSGGTNINDSLLAGFRQFDGSDRPKLLVFMTDGLPTVGETKVPRIIENARAARNNGVKLFTFGVGYEVNTELLDKLAAENNGAADYVEPKEDIEIKVSSFFAKVNYPVLTDVSLDLAGVQTDLVYPKNLPDMFKGTQITVIGRYRNASDLQNLRIMLKGKMGRESRSFAFENVDFPLRNEENDFLPRLWANRRVGWLMEQIRNNGEQKELRDEIVDLGTRYGIVTPYTSYLALESGQPVTGGNTNVVTDGQVSNMPTGRRERDPFSRPVASAPAADMAAKSGAGAVRASKDVRQRQESVSMADDKAEEKLSTAVAKRVSGKTFYKQGEVWTDADFKADARLPEVALTFGSDAYFDLLKREPALAKYFALGEAVVVVYNGHVYRITK
ncbi:MAG: VIT and VWA domain-containing protein [Pyrinomonadaceae bacterium]